MLEDSGIDRARQRSDMRDWCLVADIVGRILGKVHWPKRWRWKGSRSDRLRCGETGAAHDHFAKLGNRSTLGRVQLKDSTEDGIELQRDGKNGPQELRILHESTESAVFERCTLPWVAATG